MWVYSVRGDKSPALIFESHDGPGRQIPSDFMHSVRVAQPVWRSGQSVGLGFEKSRVRNSPVPSDFFLRQGN